MMWLTWRQFRAAALAAVVSLAALAAVLAGTASGIADGYADRLATCAARDVDCAVPLTRFAEEREVAFIAVGAVMLALPALLGLFWGAPMITRELEAGTHRLVWSQSVTRTRWLAVKLTVAGLAAMAVTGLTSLLVGWWAGPLDKAAAAGHPVFQKTAPLLFGARGVVPIGYAVFAFVLGVTVGMLVRRTLPAMAVTLAVFAALQVAMPQLVRPHLREPAQASLQINDLSVGTLGIEPDGLKLGLRPAAPDGGGWALSSRLVDKAGNTVRGDKLPIPTASGPCGPVSGRSPEDTMRQCVAEVNRRGYRQVVTYHPADRYWAFQWTETGIYLVLAAGLTGFCFWRLRRLS